MEPHTTHSDNNKLMLPKSTYPEQLHWM